MSNRYDAFEERLVNLEDKLVALQEQVNNIIPYCLLLYHINVIPSWNDYKILSIYIFIIRYTYNIVFGILNILFLNQLQ